MKYRAVFISDIHLGTRICQAERLLDFFRDNEFEQLYLVGDIVDMQAVRKHGFYWDENHNTVIQKILRMARKGVKVSYIIGNHDIFLNFLVPEHFGGIDIMERAVHHGLKGEKCLVMHGHQLDGAIRKIPWLYWLGDAMYDWAIKISALLKFFQNIMGLDEWSLSLYLKTKVKNVVQFINDYERLVVCETKKSTLHLNTVIAGHIHMADDKQIGGIRYLNCGCWTEFCSAVVERMDGGLELIRFDSSDPVLRS